MATLVDIASQVFPQGAFGPFVSPVNSGVGAVVKITRSSWPANSLVTALLEFSFDNQQSWNPAGQLSMDETFDPVRNPLGQQWFVINWPMRDVSTMPTHVRVSGSLNKALKAALSVVTA